MIRVMAPTSIPVFLQNAGIGVHRGPLPPQIREIDVYYKSPIVVGFHIIGSTLSCIRTPEIEFEITESITDPQIISFYAQIS